MKRTIAVIICALLALGFGAVYAAPKTPDAKAIVGAWKASLGHYADGATEDGIGMSLTFTTTTMSDPMSKTGETHPYKLDDKAKTISIKDRDLEMKIAYRLGEDGTLVLTELTVVKAGKTTSIIGSGDTAMFASLDFARQ
jgi:hypothetical protein